VKKTAQYLRLTLHPTIFNTYQSFCWFNPFYSWKILKKILNILPQCIQYLFSIWIICNLKISDPFWLLTVWLSPSFLFFMSSQNFPCSPFAVIHFGTPLPLLLLVDWVTEELHQYTMNALVYRYVYICMKWQLNTFRMDVLKIQMTQVTAVIIFMSFIIYIS
jgi:hypothetical protein